jgi:linoleoyl-CoA desaturase
MYRYPHDQADFYPTLKRRVRAYFADQGQTRFADRLLVTKSIVHATLAVGLYATILSNRFDGLLLVGLFSLFGFNQMMIALNIAHDASHNAYSPRPWLNRWLTRSFDFIGVNSYVWHFNHVKSHHGLTNVPLKDSAIDSFKVLSLHPRADGLAIRRYQHLYIAGVYAISTLFKFFFLDFFSFLRRRIGGIEVGRHSAGEVALLLASKAFVAGYMLLVPLWLLDASAWAIIAGFVLGHVAAGLLIGVVFQVTHLADDTEFPQPDANGTMPYPFAEHVLRVTADLTPRSRVVQWIGGGLNLHVAHHLFPHVAHTHLPALTLIIERTAAEFGIPYRKHDTVRAALASHIRLLKRLGQPRSVGRTAVKQRELARLRPDVPRQTHTCYWTRRCARLS